MIIIDRFLYPDYVLQTKKVRLGYLHPVIDKAGVTRMQPY